MSQPEACYLDVGGEYPPEVVEIEKLDKMQGIPQRGRAEEVIRHLKE